MARECDTFGPAAPPTAGDPARFHVERRTDLRRSPPWDPLAYIIRALPAGLADLVPALDAPPRPRIVDFGCADTPYRHLFTADAEYVAADLPGNPSASVDIAPDGTLPIPDGWADIVLSTQVLEHVADPRLYLVEAFRVLRPGGRMLLSTHGIMVYHPDPVDFWRWTCAGLRESVLAAGFQVVRFEGIMGLAATGLQLLQDAAMPTLSARHKPLLALVMQRLIATADRMQSADSRRANALVFALVAQKP